MMKLLVVMLTILYVDGHDFKTDRYLDETLNYAQHQKNPSQAFNVGYSVSFTNGPSSAKARQSYPDIVLGNHKEEVIRPSYDKTLPFTNSNFQAEALSTTLNLLQGNMQARAFDHAKALGGSQGFGYTDVLGINPILQFNQQQQQVPDITKRYQKKAEPEVLQTAASALNPSVMSYANFPDSVRDNVVGLGNLPATSIIINDNLEAKVVQEDYSTKQKDKDPNEEVWDTFTPKPVEYETLNEKFKLDAPFLRFYTAPTPDLNSAYSQRPVPRYIPLIRSYRSPDVIYGRPYGTQNVDRGFPMKAKFVHRGIVKPLRYRRLARRRWAKRNSTRFM